MKIIFGNNKFEIEEHAKEVISSIKNEEMRYPRRSIPMGIPFHAVRYPFVCDDCGESYWSNNEYGQHVKCDKKGNSLGF
jgi:hypothetical protein